MRLHIGCGPKVLPGWINIDVVEGPHVHRWDPLDLPLKDGSVSHILSEHAFEHFGFAEEERLFRECLRVLAPGGVLEIEVPDLEWTCRTFVDAADAFEAFYRIGSADHYFGRGRAFDQRWGIITTMLFGNQNGPGQFHKNGYTEGKLRAIAKLLGFSGLKIAGLFNKGGRALRAEFVK